ncbi:olfactory receptor 7C2-like [Tachyglossus aculeatus]|uniref:olfactory receptor 7C2-like n=1 Tax=Tachyglossus aculeatus TaxID=9261 RepID=UPI0018F3DB6A|nr:olfactory receptor 7C2-like [Tachyglossus aculeatus]
MERGNQTGVSEFLLLGLSERAGQQELLFILFLWMYLLGFLGSLIIILVIGSDPHLHTPMYFFLTNLSLADVCLLSTTVPNMLVNIQTHIKSVSYAECLAQIYFFILFGTLDHFLLTGTAYESYVDIYHPLHYTTIMGPRLCALMVSGSWIISKLQHISNPLFDGKLQDMGILRVLLCLLALGPLYFGPVKDPISQLSLLALVHLRLRALVPLSLPAMVRLCLSALVSLSLQDLAALSYLTLGQKLYRDHLNQQAELRGILLLIGIMNGFLPSTALQAATQDRRRWRQERASLEAKLKERETKYLVLQIAAEVKMQQAILLELKLALLVAKELE